MANPLAELLERGIDGDGVTALLAAGGVSALAKELGTSLDPISLGLSPSRVKANQAKYELNVLPNREPKSFFSHLKEALEDETLILLVVAAVVSTLFGVFISPEDSRQADIIQGLAILLAVVVVSAINSFQNWSKDKEFTSLADLKKDRKIFVRRGGNQVEISIFEVTVGDIVDVNSGDAIPADGILIDGTEVTVDQSSMNGESETAPKEPLKAGAKAATGDCVLTSSCRVAEGEGRMLVTAVGKKSSIGRLVQAVEEAEEKRTPLQEKLDELAGQIGKVGMVVGALTFLVLFVFWYFNPLPIVYSSEDPSSSKSYMDLLQYVIIGIAIVVVAVPEGLPLAVTVSLAFSMRQMMADKNMVRELQACETMGSATVIASDKTGTLTQNRMAVVRAAFFELPPSEPTVALRDAVGIAAHRLNNAIAFNTTAELDTTDDTRPASVTGSPTEGALLLLGSKFLGLAYKPLRLQRDAAAAVLHRKPFNKADKYQAIVVDENKLSPLEPKFPVLYVTGAPEIVMARCSLTATTKGDEVPLAPERRSHLASVVEDMAKEGLRTLALAYRRLPEGSDPKTADSQDGLVLLGVVGIQDPLRAGVTNAITRCQSAGIRVVMVTGDHKDTAKKIASECGIYKPGMRVMEGREFREMAEGDRKALVAKDNAQPLAVLSRCSPTDKLLLVEALQANMEVVAVTGDGTNDAPALKAADVGLAMGIAGTEVAKEAADIIILDDEFDSIVKAVVWGRSIKENIRKFLSFQLTINIVALLLTFVTACATGQRSELPLKPVQLLWLNLIMDSFAALALATEPPSEKLLNYAPQGKDEPLITWTMVKNMVGHAAFQSVLLLWMTRVPSSATFFGLTPEQHSGPVHDTIVFTTFVALQVFNLFNCRAVHDEWNVLEGFGGSSIAQGILLVICGSQFALVQFGGDIMQTRPLSAGQWTACIALGLLSIPVGALLKLIPSFERTAAKPAAPAKIHAVNSETAALHALEGSPTSASAAAAMSALGGIGPASGSASIDGGLRARKGGAK